MSDIAPLDKKATDLIETARKHGSISKLLRLLAEAGISHEQLELPSNDVDARKHLVSFLQAECPDFVRRASAPRLLKRALLEATREVLVDDCFRADHFNPEFRDKEFSIWWTAPHKSCAPTTVGSYEVHGYGDDSGPTYSQLFGSMMGLRHDAPSAYVATMLKALRHTISPSQLNAIIQHRVTNRQNRFALYSGTAVVIAAEREDGSVCYIDACEGVDKKDRWRVDAFELDTNTVAYDGMRVIINNPPETLP